MTIEVDADYFRTHWVKSSASCKASEAESAARIGKPVDDLHYSELLARIERLHESFEAWCGSKAEAQANLQSEQEMSGHDGAASRT